MNADAPGKRWLTPALLFLACLHCGSPPGVIEIRGATMGTSYTVKVVTPPAQDKDALRAGVQGVVDEIEARMSHWRPDSDVSRFNRHDSDQPMEISPATAATVANALEIWRRTDGALDPTLGPLIDLWGFGAEERGPFPLPEQIARAKARTGGDKLRLEGVLLSKSDPSLTLNLSANAKGYAVDQAAALLEKAGAKSYMVEIGGETRVSGRNQQGAPWRMAILHPRSGLGQEIYKVANLSGAALATSGDYRNFFEHEGQRYGHILDPRNGYPITSGVTSVSVIAEDCMTADALATGLMALEPDRALETVEAMEGVECMILIIDEDGRIEERLSSGMAAFLGQTNSSANR